MDAKIKSEEPRTAWTDKERLQDLRRELEDIESWMKDPKSGDLVGRYFNQYGNGVTIDRSEAVRKFASQILAHPAIQQSPSPELHAQMKSLVNSGRIRFYSDGDGWKGDYFFNRRWDIVHCADLAADVTGKSAKPGVTGELELTRRRRGDNENKGL